MEKMVNLLIVAPFWNHKNHVGVYRVDRFLRWLNEKGYGVVLVSAGGEERVREHTWGKEITIIDRLNKQTEFTNTGKKRNTFKLLRRIQQFFLYFFLIPDKTIFWAFNVVRSSRINEIMKDVQIVFSSSPPESVHIASYMLSKKYSVPLCIDMRDGWLDEPLKPALEQFWLRKYIEKRIEEKILLYADRIFVTSSIWKEVLIDRYPSVRLKTTVLTNGYPLHYEDLNHLYSVDRADEKVSLMHIGQFTASHMKRKVKYLLAPILYTLEKYHPEKKGDIILLGFLGPKDMSEVNYWRRRYGKVAWAIEHVSYIPRPEMFTKIKQATGLILLEVKHAGIPSKIFEYIPTGKPILAATPRGGAVWEMCKDIPQVYLFDCFEEGDVVYSRIHDFFVACTTGVYDIVVPPDYSEEYLSKIFMTAIENITVN